MRRDALRQPLPTRRPTAFQKELAKLDKAIGVPHGNRGRQSERRFDHAKMVLR
jgi:hypothetical protein